MSEYSKTYPAFKKSGTGPVQLVLLHGYCEGAWIWKDLITHLEDLCTILAFDLPGFGEAASSPLPSSIDEIGETIWKVSEEAGFDRPVLIGHSLGGYVALAMADSQPEKPSGLVLFQSTIFADTPEKKLNREKVIETVTDHGPTPFLKTFSTGLFAYPEGDEAKWFGKKALSTSGSSITAYARIMKERPERIKIWQKLACPLLVVAGRKDNVIDVSLSQKAISLNPMAELKILEKSGHMGMLEEPQDSCLILVDFLRRCQGGH